MESDVVSSAAVEWRDQAIGWRSGSIEVLDAALHLDEDVNGQTAIFLDLTVSAPPGDAGTWPVDDVLSLHRSLDDRARNLGLGQPWHIRLQAAGEPAAEDDEASEGTEW